MRPGGGGASLLSALREFGVFPPGSSLNSHPICAVLGLALRTLRSFCDITVFHRHTAGITLSC